MQKVTLDPKIVYAIWYACEINKRPEIYRQSTSKFVLNACTFSEIDRIDEILKHIYFLGYTKNKGIWDERMYPVFWYFNKDLKNAVFYDEHFNESLVSEIINKPDDKRLEILGQLLHIFTQVNVYDEMERILSLLLVEGPIQYSVEKKGYTSLYYSVACVNISSGNVLIAKRSGNRHHLKNVWDFGSVQDKTTSINHTLEKEYHELFGINIKLITDKERGDNIRPFGFSTTYYNGRPNSCILCHAVIHEEDEQGKPLTDDVLIQKIEKHISESDLYTHVRLIDYSKSLKYTPLTIEDIEADSLLGSYSKPFGENCCIQFFAASVNSAIEAFAQWRGVSESDGRRCFIVT